MKLVHKLNDINDHRFRGALEWIEGVRVIGGTNRVTPLCDWKVRVYLAMVACWLKKTIALGSGLEAVKKIGEVGYRRMIADTWPTSPFGSIPSIGMEGYAVDSLRKFLIAQNLIPEGIKASFLYSEIDEAFEWLVNEQPSSHCCLLCLVSLDKMKTHALGMRRQSSTVWELLEPSQGLFLTEYPSQSPRHLLLSVLDGFHLHFMHHGAWWVMIKVSS